MYRLAGALALALVFPLTALADPLPSWNDTASETAIVDFVTKVTDPASPDFVPEEERIAVFDNDGTLWSEKPLYFQGLYALDKLREKAKADPSILTDDVLRAANAGDMKGVMAGGEKGLVEILNVSHSDISVEDFQASARDWITGAKHPTTGLTYAEMTYQPMVELLSYLRDNGFRTYIVSGGGVDFMRSVSKKAYGIPTWQVIGSQGKTAYEVRDGVPTLWKEGGIFFLDDKAGKPVGIISDIGQRPIFTAGNSDGDFQMLEWTTAGEGPRFGLIVHHTDAKREFAYDRDSDVGRLAEALDQAPAHGWVVVDMAKDWSRIWTGAK
ncbi:HAD family hydrolase [Amaricoccus solimangrovi]|uniref:Haloacid dehalogenase-like hydrolase n=1 Tax=Amaricoccus solimangrovi TaxID=2589815 RepID=A0A501WVS1_9RHOB|nr:HAD family hydrolase [Amaricoccus solimangrovi]TPE53518.1 haloacid dehalogenase-like hydrolase [Amaricoccus solimangrovi]